MLIDFTVENYRSIKEPVTLSAVAAKKSGRKSGGKRRPGVVPDDEIAPPYVVEGRGFELLPVLGIFGANASGKTNLVQALDKLLMCMAYGMDVRIYGQRWFFPHILSDVTLNSPCSLEVRLVIEGTLYAYSVDVYQQEIRGERLELIPSSSKATRYRNVFSREAIGGSHKWRNGLDLGKGFNHIQESFRSTELFLPFLLSRFNVASLNPLYVWLISRWPHFASDQNDQHLKMTITVLKDRKPEWLSDVAHLIKQFDTQVSGLQIVNSTAIPSIATDGDYTVMAEHISDGRSIIMPFYEESHGTQHMLTLGTRAIAALREGTLLIVDELEAGLHPNITNEIIRLFQDLETNPRRSQLLFSSHDNTLLDNNLLRRDQVWFTEKRADGSTNLYSLADFNPRNDLAIDKAYLSGRFGAVPFLPGHEFLLPDREAA